MKSIEQILTELGLTDNEAKVFLSAVKTGLAPLSRIAKGAGVSRTYVYELVEQLKEKGLLAEIEEGKTKKIQALDYGGLVAYVERRQKEMVRLERDLLKSSAAFHALTKGVSKPTKVRFFEGVEGIKSINTEIRKDLEKLKATHSFYVVFSADRMEAVLQGWIEHNQHIYYEPFMRKFAIISQTPQLEQFLEQVRENRQKNFEYKIWPQHKEFPTDTLCWMNKIAYLDMEGRPSGIIIENKAMVDTFVMWFEQMWGSL